MPRVIRNNLISLIFVVAIFLVDRLTKIYILNLSEGGTEVDFYIFSFLNIYLVWNSGVGFGCVLAGLDVAVSGRFRSG